MKHTKDNKIRIEVLSKIKETQWNGNTIHNSIDACLTAINLDSNNSGWYSPIAVRIPKLKGIYMINEDGSLFFEARIIKEDTNKYRIEYLLMSGYNEFERMYSELM
jgi:hypothetical protein